MHISLPISRPALALLALCTPLAALAQQAAAVPQLDPVIVTAARMTQDEASTLGDVSVIDRATLARAGQQSVAQVLGWAPGVEFYESGGPQGVSGVSIRGANFNQTLVLIDGVRINDASSGGSAINALTADQIERIEILRGPASSLYGADAVGGVIHIITRSAEGDQPLSANGSLGIGSRGRYQGSVNLSGAADGWRYSAGATYRQSRHYDITTPSSSPYSLHNPDRDSYYQRNLRATVAYRWQPGQELELATLHSRINGGYDNGQPYHNDRAINTLDLTSLSSRNQLTEQWHSTLRVSTSLDKKLSDTISPENSVFKTRQYQYQWQNDITLTSDQRLALALERLEQRVDGTLEDWSQYPPLPTNYDVRRRHTNSATLVYLADIDRNHVQANLRHDRESQFGNRTTGNLAYAYDLSEQWRAGVSAGTAFRAPTFNDLYFPGYANPDLAPEKSRQIEFNLRYLLANGSLSLTAYRNQVRNLIAYDGVAGKPMNLGRATLEGITLQAEQQFGATTLNASLDLQNPHDRETGEQLIRRAKRLFKLQATHQWGAWEAGAQWQAVSQRFDGSGAARTRLGGYTLLDLTLGYQLTRDLDVQVRWDNVFDRRYVQIEGYRTEGSNVLATLNWKY